MKGGSKVVVEQHRHEGVFIARAKEDVLCTLNSTPGKDVYGEKRISVTLRRKYYFFYKKKVLFLEVVFAAFSVSPTALT